MSLYVWILYKEISIHQYTFIFVLNTFHGRKFMACPSDKNDKYFTGSHIFCLAKICFISYHQRFLWKTKKKLFSKLLKVFRKTQVVGSGFNKFLQFAAIVKIDVLLGIIFHNCQTKNYMTPPGSIPLNILRICSVSQVAFCPCTDLNLVVTFIICRGIYLEPIQTSIMECFYDNS